ncbi:NTP transferase domain-containing protein [Streptomyces sp. BE147]|uniref:NTP transferase domain-containing protein n=1 Tax=Streptomyces sp. BE147 TaxID=3002524 RepID=UPI002E7A49C4|nr:NTP transferase domain-containing protein [Streptomyces sp. BE147]MEE1736697.1 NTP transferase domain-containing protein [Streptomyces sp. BE147]
MKLTDARYVIVQAGGRGTRLEHHTANKPKCLLSIDGEPLLYRLFRQLPGAHFIVIADTHIEALTAYLATVPPSVQVTVVPTSGTGSLAGMREAIALTVGPEDAGVADDAGAGGEKDEAGAPTLLLWCDLFFDEGLPDIELGELPDGLVIVGTGDGLRCRWSIDDTGRPVEISSEQRGIAGVFFFPDSAAVQDLPGSGEFVGSLRASRTALRPLVIPGIREFGTVSAVREYLKERKTTRFFNSVEFRSDKVVKTARLQEFEHLIQAESDWYEYVGGLGFAGIPRMLSRSPLTLDRVPGHNPFDLTADAARRSTVTERIMESLDQLHRYRSVPADPAAVHEMYYTKTLDRLRRTERLIPNADAATLIVNGRHCRNPLHPANEEWFRARVESVGTVPFALVHGDPTFSNMLVTGEDAVWLIDPRGTFGGISYYGDPRYDWAKLLYSAEGNYDQFNRGDFLLRVDGATVSLTIASNGWEDQAKAIRERVADDEPAVDVIHALIWLSLSGYVLNDFDSVLGAFYNGIHHLEATERADR